MRKVSRRRFVGLGSAAAAVAPLLPMLQARGQTGAGGYPRRLFLIFWPGGTTVGQNWPVGTETDFSFQPLLSALEPWKQKLIVFQNLRRRNDGSRGGHQAGTGGTWTAAKMLNATGPNPWVSLPSIDRIIMKEAPPPTPFSNLDLEVRPNTPNNLRAKTLFDHDGRPVAGEMDPSAAFDRVFTDGVAVPTAGDPKVAERLRFERKSILDHVRRELDDVRQRLGGQDRRKLEQHLEALRSTENRLSPANAGQNGVPAMLPSKTDFPKLDFQANDNYPTVGKMHMDLAVAALAADRTRIVSLQWSQGNGNVRHTWVGVDAQHHALQHRVFNSPDHDKIHRWYYEQFAYLLSRMAAIPEGDGTLLDNSVVAFANELISGYTHRSDPWPLILAGSGGGHFKTGRFLAYPDLDAGMPTSAPNQTQVLTSLCHYMGARVERVGDPSHGPAGPLPDLG